MAKINTNQPMLDLAGTPIEGAKDSVKKNADGKFTVGEALSTILINAKIGGAMKLYTLGTDLFQKDEVDVDAADISILSRAVEGSTTYNALVIGQLLVFLDTLKA